MNEQETDERTMAVIFAVLWIMVIAGAVVVATAFWLVGL